MLYKKQAEAKEGVNRLGLYYVFIRILYYEFLQRSQVIKDFVLY